MDERKEDRSEESRKNHIAYYGSLCRVIQEIQEEINVEPNSTVKSHLQSRIEAVEKDKKRVKDMFPDMKEDEWNGNTG